MPDYPAGTPVRPVQMTVAFKADGTVDSVWVNYNLIGATSGQPIKNGATQILLTAAQATALAQYAATAASQAKTAEGV